MMSLVCLVPLMPLLGAALLGLFGKKLTKNTAGIIGSGVILAAFIISLISFFNLKAAKPEIINLFTWIKAGDFKADFSFQIDELSSLFMLIITGIGFLIHVYSTAYMHEDEGHNRYFAYLNLFVFFMLLLVMGSNYLLMFVGWEGVGLCSYLLIGFWFKNDAYNNAAKKAFIMNRIGDLGFILGIILLFITFGSINYTDVFQSANKFASGETAIICITLLLFVGAMGKSAQIPLYTWLPDAMAGPTPVSALIHAATMVTAGIYMIARSNILFSMAPFTMEVIAIVGLVTALFAATIGLVQNDIKKVLAYSTVSQLGYMFLGLGVGAYTGAVFHVTTHAFFKALLFLGAGSVIHGMSGDQDIRNMGGLKKKMPVTYITFLLGTIAISGIPPFSGFFSKDEILANVYAHNKFYWLLAVIGAMMTAFYMFRLLFLTFFGEFRGTDHQAHHLHESPKAMTIPLIILSVLSVIGGFMGIPEVLHGHHFLKEYLAPIFSGSQIVAMANHLTHETEYMLIGIAILTAAVSIYYAYDLFAKKATIPAAENEELKPIHKLVYHKYWVDELYEKVITKPYNWISDISYRFVELRFIDAIVNGTGTLVNRTAIALRYIQTGSIGFYIFAMTIGIALILLLTLI
ncbi:MAG: NADH-quinone oxidoreductase subunit L [Bacteroidetes bacterium]|nr:NADH-quinone oxidoreductase subunit L [Bacteroidota bacterium]